MVGFLPVAFVLAARMGAGREAFAILGGTVAIAVLGLVDDLRPLPARWRFGVQLAAAIAVVGVAGPRVSEAWTLVPLPEAALAVGSVLWIVWVTNLYNFMDGIDGLAGGQAVIAAIGIAEAAGAATLPGALALALGAAALGFLTLNFPPASIFMGDVGSTAMGFFLASVPFLPSSSAIPVEVVAVALALFVLDATTTLVRRLAKGERFYQAHRSHWYQRPLACGVSHRAITLVAYAGMAITAALAARSADVSAGGRAGFVLAATGVFAVYVLAVRLLERHHALREIAKREHAR
jgi:UDP-N-acetylmuramyl pentapeptide phosphotransferase/UDP-N-acetylglucosamine-1-phosphate transferase